MENKIEERNVENKIYIKESGRIIKRLSKAEFTGNKIFDSLIYRNVKTEYVTKTFEKKIADKAENEELLLDILKENKKSFNLLTSFASSGKTYTINSVFNKYRDYRKELDEEFLKDLLEAELSKESNEHIKKKIEGALLDKEYQVNSSRHKVEKLIKQKASKEKIDAAKIKHHKLTEDISTKAKEDFLTKEFDVAKKGRASIIKEINEYLEEAGGSIIQILVTPNRIQNEQNQEEAAYNYTAVIGQNGEYIKFNSDTNYSVVIEKLTEILSTIEHGSTKAKINLVIDEAHVLVEQKNFRGEAINGLIQVVSKVLELGGAVIFMTATPNNLKCFNFDKIISFIPEDEIKMADKIKVYYKEEKSTVQEYVVSLAEHLENPLIYYNTKDGIRRAKESLEGLKRKVDTVTADGKNEELFKNIVSSSALTKADKWLCSSVIEVGTNIKGVLQDDGCIKQEVITPTYILNNINNCKMDSIIQFFARIRYHLPEYVLCMPHHEGYGDRIKSIETILNEEISKVETSYDRFNKTLDFLKATFPEEVAVQMMKKALETEFLDGTHMNYNCIYFDEADLAVKVDTVSLWKSVYDKYNEQLYYHPDLLISRLEKELGVPVEVATENITIVKSKIEDSSPETKALAYEALSEMTKKDIAVLENVVSKILDPRDITDEEQQERIGNVLKYKKYAEYLKKAYNLELKFTKIVEVILNAKRNSHIEYYLMSAQYVKGNILYQKGKPLMPIEQDIMLKKFCTLKPDGKIVKRTITKSDLEEIRIQINMTTKKHYAYKDIYKLFNHIFNTTDCSTDTEEKYKIEYLYTKPQTY